MILSRRRAFLPLLAAVTLLLLAWGVVPPRPAATALVTVALFFDKPHADDTADQLATLARRNALVFGAGPKQIPVLRAANPRLEILMYEQPAGTTLGAPDYPYLDQRETWWVHDDKGSRMHEMGGGPNYSWLLHIGKSGYRTYEKNKITSGVVDNGFDGVFLDTSNPYWPIFRDWYDVNNRRTTPTSDVLAGWPDWMLSFHQELKALLGSKTQIFNSWPNNPGRYDEYKYWVEKTIAAVDGTQDDGFCYNRSQPWSTSSWQYQVTSAQRILGMGKIAMLKSPMDNLQQDLGKLHQLQRFCFGSYLLVADGKNAYFRNPDEADVVYWNERLFTAPIGQPTGAYYTVGDLYRRDFTNGTVIVNPTTADKKIDLGMAYYRLKGTTDRIVTIKALSGLILLTTAPPP